MYMKHTTTMQNSGEMNIMLDLGECDEYGAYYHHTGFRRDEHPAGPRECAEHRAYYHHTGFRRDEHYAGSGRVMNTEDITTIQDSGEMNILQGQGVC